MVEVRSGYWVSEGWSLIKPYLGTHILIALVAGLLSSVTIGILSGPLACGWFMILLRQRRDPSYAPQFADLWKGFEVFGQAFVAWLLIAIVVGIAGALVGVVAAVVSAIPIIGQLLAPLTGAVMAICATAILVFVFPLIADRRADAVEAIKRSAETTTPEFIPFAGFALILYVLNAIGGALCGLGLLITGPIMAAAVAVSYEDALGGSAASGEAAELAPQMPEAPEPVERPESDDDAL
ncbi:MAG: hypothetical protein ACOX9R_05260 [Armatimonadota bacterium]|jgi:hypothetical protein